MTIDDLGLNFVFRPDPKGTKGKLFIRQDDKEIYDAHGDLGSPTFREKVVREFCKLFPGLNEKEGRAALLAELVAANRAKMEPEPESDDEERGPSPEELLEQYDRFVADVLGDTPVHIREEAEALLVDLCLISKTIDAVHELGVVGEDDLILATFMVGVSRLLEEPLAAIVQGDSSTGKSYVIERTGDLFPEESLLRTTSFTRNSLYYARPGRLQHRFVLGGERSHSDDDEQADNTKCMREMISSQNLYKFVTVTEGGHNVAVEIHQPGPISFIESTTKAMIFPEDRNRALLLATDDSEEQTDRIVRAKARQSQERRPSQKHSLAVQHAAQRMLRRVHVEIPYGDALAEVVPKSRVEARRVINQITTMISAVACYQQRRRTTGTIEHGDVIEATLDDYAIARQLLMGPLGRSLSGDVTPAVRRFGHSVVDLYGRQRFKISDVLNHKQQTQLSSEGNVRDYLKSLAAVGYAEQIGKEGKAVIWQMTVDEIPEIGAVWLPSVDQLQEVADVA